MQGSLEIQMNYVRYSQDVESIAPDEAETFQKIVEAMGKGGKIARDRYGKSVGSGLIDYIQKMTAAAMQMADMKVWAQRS